MLTGIFGVNVTVYDEWPQFFYFFSLKHGALSFDQLWLDGNLHRQIFSRLFSLALDLISNGNAKFEMLVDALLMIAAFALLATHLYRKYGYSMPSIAIVGLIVLSADQVENLVNGCDNSSAMVLIALIATGVLLDSGTISTFAFAILASVIGSYSLFQGLLVWVAGAVLLGLKRRPAFLGIWLGIAFVDFFCYFYHIHWEWANPTRVPLTNAFAHPFAIIGFALGLLGTITGSLSILNSTQASPQVWWIVWLVIAGTILLALTVAVLRTVRLRLGETPLALYFTTIGISFVVVTCFGRVSSGWYGANISRYATMTMLLVLGLWIVVQRNDSRLRRTAASFIVVAYATSLCAAIFFGVQTRREHLIAADVLMNLATRPRADVERYLGYPSEVRVVRSFAEVEQHYSLGSFADAQALSSPAAVESAITRAPFAISPACNRAIRAKYLADASLVAARPLELPVSYIGEPSCRGALAHFTSADEPGIVPRLSTDFFLNGGLAWDDGPPVDIHVWGDGTMLNLYASTRPVEPRNVRQVRLSAIVDDRSVHSGRMCIYAEWDGGSSPEVCAAADGTIRRLETPPITLVSAKSFWYVAHFSNVTPEYGRLVSFDDPLIVPIR